MSAEEEKGAPPEGGAEPSPAPSTGEGKEGGNEAPAAAEGKDGAGDAAQTEGKASSGDAAAASEVADTGGDAAAEQDGGAAAGAGGDAGAGAGAVHGEGEAKAAHAELPADFFYSKSSVLVPRLPLELPRDNAALSHLFGFDFQKFNNVKLLGNDTILSAAGNVVLLYSALLSCLGVWRVVRVHPW